MATTSGALALKILGEIERSGAKYAVLHNSNALLSDAPTSDVDLAVDLPGWEIARRIVSSSFSELRLVLLWESETATLNTFWATADGLNGVQVDLLYDPGARSRIGIGTTSLLHRRVYTGTHWAVAEPDKMAYLISKRWLKGDRRRVASYRVAARDLLAEGDAPRRWGRVVTRRMKHVAAGRVPSAKAFLLNVAVSRATSRSIRRLVRHAGRIVIVPDGVPDHEMIRIAEALRRFLPEVIVLRQVATPLRAWLNTLRPRVVLARKGRGWASANNLREVVAVLAEQTVSRLR